MRASAVSVHAVLRIRERLRLPLHPAQYRVNGQMNEMNEER
jgi:hypothetical protein